MIKKGERVVKKMKKLAITFLSLMMAISLTACGGSKDDSGEKVFRFGQSNPKVGLDMQTNTNSGASSVADNVVEGLLRWTDDNELECVLITDFPTVSEDGLTYSFELKEGVKFSDGSDLTSEDVKYTFERMFKINGTSTYMYDMIKGAKALMEGQATELEGFKIEDDLHFSITLEYKFATFTSNLGIDYASIYPKEACEKAGDDWGKGTNLIGTGPYVIVENDEQTKVVMEPNENYHGGTPNLDRLEIVYIDDYNTKMMEYEAGNIDMCDLDKSLLDQYQNSDIKDEITQITSLGTYFLQLKYDDPAFKDQRVREALSLAINREELCETVLNGAAEPASSFLNPAIPGHDKELDTYEYNLDKAKKLLADAGVNNLELSCKVKSDYEKVATALQGYLSKAGITLNVEILDNGVWSEARSNGSLQTTLNGWFPLYADADNQMYTYFYSSISNGKGVFYKNDKFDQLMDEARQTTDNEEKRSELYKQADYILSREDYAVIPLYYGKMQFVAKPYVKNAKLSNLVYHIYNIDIDLSKK